MKTERPPPVLPYATPAEDAPIKVFRYNKLSYVLEVAFIGVGAACGIGSDFITISLPKKVAITAAGVSIGSLALTALWHGKIGFHLVFLGFASMMTFVMWFWN